MGRRAWFWFVSYLTIAYVLLAPQLAYAVPDVWNFNAVFELDGATLADGHYSGSFALYSSPQGGAPLWQVRQIVPVQGGYVTATLPLPTSNDGQDLFSLQDVLWMEVTLDFDGAPTALDKRVQIAAAPYARRAGDCSTVGGLTPDELRGQSSGGTGDTAQVSEQLRELSERLAQLQARVDASSQTLTNVKNDLTAHTAVAITQQNFSGALDAANVMRKPDAGSPAAAVTHAELNATLANYVTLKTYSDTLTSEVATSVQDKIPTRIEAGAVGLANGLSQVVSLGREPSGSGVTTDVMFENVNVHVRSGTGSTSCPSDVNGNLLCNGRGNLVLGYNGLAPANTARTGSHNLVIGDGHTYSGFGGFVSGINNTVSGEYGSAIGGMQNSVSGRGAVVAGGWNNIASGEYAAISAGSGNHATGTAAAVTGGSEHVASGSYASISGGRKNQVTTSWASVSGGYNNIASASYSSISGGRNNQSTAQYSSTLGGYNNKASGTYSVILGGRDKDASASYALADLPIVRSGNDLIIEGVNLVVRDGTGNTPCSDTGSDTCSGLGNIIIGYNESSTTKTGQHNLVLGKQNSFSSYGGIVSGYQNTIAGAYSSAIGGSQNAANGTYNVVIAGYKNKSDGRLSAIVGGRENHFAGSEMTGESAVIVGGYNNVMRTEDTKWSIILGGNGNGILGNTHAIVGGSGGQTWTGSNNLVLGGFSNQLGANTTSSVVVGGSYNGGAGNYSTTVGGSSNDAKADNSVVVGGRSGEATGLYSGAFGGNNNKAAGDYSTVEGGHDKTANTDYQRL